MPEELQAAGEPKCQVQGFTNKATYNSYESMG